MAISGRWGGRTHLVFALFYSRLGHRIDDRESGDQVQMRSFMPRLQKLNYLCPAAAAAAAERTAGGKEEGEGSRQKPAICLGFHSNGSSPGFSPREGSHLTKQVKACGWHPDGK